MAGRNRLENVGATALAEVFEVMGIVEACAVYACVIYICWLCVGHGISG